MIEFLGFAITYEALIAMGTALAIDELLPFLPTKAKGIVHAIVLGIKKSGLGRGAKKLEDERIDEVLRILKKWDKEVEK